MTTAIDTTKVTGRRPLRFESLADIRADIDRLANAREVRTLGNLSAGQNLKHVATIMNRCIDGFTTRPPWIVRFIVQTFMRTKFLTKPMSAGFKLPKAAAAELIPAPPVLFDEGVASLRAAIDRLNATTTRSPSPVLGVLSVDEWNQLHCRHAELHLSFLLPEN